MPYPSVWASNLLAPLSKAYSLLTQKKVAVPFMGAVMTAPIIGSALDKPKTRAQRLAEFDDANRDLKNEVANNYKQAALNLRALDKLLEVLRLKKKETPPLSPKDPKAVVNLKELDTAV